MSEAPRSTKRRGVDAVGAAGDAPTTGSGTGDGGGESDATRPLENFEVALNNVSSQIQPLLDVPWQSLTSSLRDDEKAKLSVGMAFTLTSLYYMYLRTKGVPTKNHKVQAQLERVKGYMSRLQQHGKPEGERQPPPPPPKPSMRVDQAATQRFVTAALAGNEDGDEGDAAAKQVRRGGVKRSGTGDEDGSVGGSRGGEATDKVSGRGAPKRRRS